MSSESEIIISGADVDRQVGFSVRNKESFFLPASEFQGYENTVPGAGKELLNLFTDQVRHRMEMEKDELHIDITIGFVAVMLFSILAVFFGCIGMENAAIACVSCPALYGLSNLFRKQRSGDRKK